MASINRGSSMRGGKSRRSMSEINVVPYIDVMLVLLVIFMVTAPLVTPGTVDLPSVSRSSAAPPTLIEVVIKADKTMLIRIRDPKSPLEQSISSADELVPIITQRQRANPDSPPPVIIAADKTVQYDAVLKVMDKLQTANIKRVGLSVKPAPN
jgi:biopolymer transport protein TolR